MVGCEEVEGKVSPVLAEKEENRKGRKSSTSRSSKRESKNGEKSMKRKRSKSGLVDLEVFGTFSNNPSHKTHHPLTLFQNTTYRLVVYFSPQLSGQITYSPQPWLL